MKVILNGSELETDAENIAELIESTTMAGKPVIVEVNKKALVASEHKTTTLGDGDKIEVLTLGAGG